MQDIIFETERLYVRRYQESDAENFFLLNSDPEVMRYIRLLKTREESDHFLLQNIVAYSKNPMTGRWSVHRKNDDLFVGTFAIIPLQDTSFWQVGYALLRHEWSKGYASELLQTGIQYGFRRMMVSKLAAVVEISNEGSKQVLQKAGFMQKDNFVEDGKELSLFELNNKAITETDRLLIAMLDKHQLELYGQRDYRFENELRLNTGDRVVSSDLEIAGVVIDKAQNRLIGEISSKGEVVIFAGFMQMGFENEVVTGLTNVPRIS